MTTPIFPSVIGHNLLDGGTDAQDGNSYPGPLLQDYAAAVVGAAAGSAESAIAYLRATLGEPADYLNVDSFRLAIRPLLRAAWERKVARLNPGTTFQGNLGSVVYIDPQAATNGVGTLASPRNNFPAFASNQTLLLKAGSVWTGQINVGGYTNWLIGTYDPRTGGRVIDKSRLATINANGATGINMSGAQVNQWVSGIKVVNYSGNGVLKGANAGASGGGIEHCYATDPVSGVMVTAIQSFVSSAHTRFNRVDRQFGDGIWVGQSGNAGSVAAKIYGNDVQLTTGNYDGPDAIQLSYGGASGAVEIYANWLANEFANSKHIAILQYSGAPQAGDSLLFRDNYCIGCDVSMPRVGSNDQNGIYSTFPNTSILRNYAENSRYPINCDVDSAVIDGNLILVDMLGTLLAGIQSNTFTTAGRIWNNTIIGLRAGGTPEAISTIYKSNTRNNIIIGNIWAKQIEVSPTDADRTESHNGFDSRCPTLVDTGTVLKSHDTTDVVGIENLVDAMYRPLAEICGLVGNAAPGHTVDEDVFGTLPVGAPNIRGALYLPPSDDRVSRVPALVAVSSNATGAWFRPVASVMRTLFSVESAGGGALTVTVQGKNIGQSDSAAQTITTVALGGANPLTSVGSAIDASAYDLVRCVISGYNGHGLCDLYVKL